MNCGKKIEDRDQRRRRKEVGEATSQKIGQNDCLRLEKSSMAFLSGSSSELSLPADFTIVEEFEAKRER